MCKKLYPIHAKSASLLLLISREETRNGNSRQLDLFTIEWHISWQENRKQEIRYQEISCRKTALSQEISWFCQNWPKSVSSKKPASLRDSFIHTGSTISNCTFWEHCYMVLEQSSGGYLGRFFKLRHETIIWARVWSNKMCYIVRIWNFLKIDFTL